MTQVVHVRDHVILDVAQIEANLGPGSDGVLLRAAFGEAFDHVGFAAEKPHQRHDLLAAIADELKERSEVVMTNGKHLVFNGVGLNLNRVDDRDKSVDDIVTVSA